MPSPFPGMDPFLEDPALWPDVHNTLIGVIREFLVRRLSAKYYARIEERVYVSDDDDPGRITVIDRADRSVVTVIEVVSPSNKVSGSRGRDSYRKKRTEVLHSPRHWLEIDLLRSGTPWIPRQMTTQGDYFVYLSRSERRPHAYLWPIRLPESLPVVAVPLKDGDADVPLDLQTALATAYERAGYERVVDYRKPPEIPLPEKYDAWADQLLKSKNLR